MSLYKELFADRHPGLSADVLEGYTWDNMDEGSLLSLSEASELSEASAESVHLEAV